MRPGCQRAGTVRSVVTIVLAGIAVTGCFGRGDKPADCARPQLYQQAGTVPPITIPPDLDKPDNRDKLIIPDPSPIAEQRYNEDRCLELPPDYFDKPVLHNDESK